MPSPFERRAERALREVPLLVGAELVLGTRRELEARLHLEQVVEKRGEVEAREDLVFDLLRRHEDMRVVLGHVLHARRPWSVPARSFRCSVEDSAYRSGNSR